MKHGKDKSNNFSGQVSFKAKIWELWAVVRIIYGIFIVVLEVTNQYI